jgi:hypothetical protein
MEHRFRAQRNYAKLRSAMIFEREADKQQVQVSLFPPSSSSFPEKSECGKADPLSRSTGIEGALETGGWR